jgi:hypothetical protein
MKKLSILFSAAFLLFFTSCEKVIGEGDLRTETRTTGSFSGMEVQISGNVFYIQGNEYKVELTAQQNILNVIETPIINNKLVVRFKNDVRVRSHEQITVRVTAPSISGIALSGSGNVTVSSPLVSNELSFNISGSGNMMLPTITTSHLEATISGSGNISIVGGTANTETLKISGSGGIDARNVLAKSATTTTSGSGTIHLNVSETLNATISGSGSVYYSGNPIINTNISGSGRVIHL